MSTRCRMNQEPTYNMIQLQVRCACPSFPAKSRRLRFVRRCTDSGSNRQSDAKCAFGTHRTEATMRTVGPTCVAPLKEHIMFASTCPKNWGRCSRLLTTNEREAYLASSSDLGISNAACVISTVATIRSVCIRAPCRAITNCERSTDKENQICATINATVLKPQHASSRPAYCRTDTSAWTSSKRSIATASNSDCRCVRVSFMTVMQTLCEDSDFRRLSKLERCVQARSRHCRASRGRRAGLANAARDHRAMQGSHSRESAHLRGRSRVFSPVGRCVGIAQAHGLGAPTRGDQARACATRVK